MGLIHTFQSAHNKAKQQAPSKWLLLNLFKFDNYHAFTTVNYCTMFRFFLYQCLYNFFLAGGLIEFKKYNLLIDILGTILHHSPFPHLVIVVNLFQSDVQDRSSMCHTMHLTVTNLLSTFLCMIFFLSKQLEYKCLSLFIFWLRRLWALFIVCDFVLVGHYTQEN